MSIAGAGAKRNAARRPRIAGEDSPASQGKAPRTARGERTLRKILDAAAGRVRRARLLGRLDRRNHPARRVALGTFYTYFDSKEAVFRALVSDMSARVRDHVAPALKDASDTLDGEGEALESYLEFARSHKQVYRIIDEAEFADPHGFDKHYRTTAAANRRAARRRQGEGRGGRNDSASQAKSKPGRSWE
jgi:AcrR family transcriptional regulator